VKDIPAFPKTPFIEVGTPQNGMTLRDYFAAKAMPIVFSSHTRDPKFLNFAAKLAYKMADTMMEARNAAQ
jgi:hypothetical protein